jgi:hypothetical protein
VVVEADPAHGDGSPGDIAGQAHCAVLVMGAPDAASVRLEHSA